MITFAQQSTDQLPMAKLKKPQMSDTIKANIYADNWFMLYINGELAAVDSIKFIPHNVISVDLLPTYPMTIAVMAKDNADPKLIVGDGNGRHASKAAKKENSK